MRGSKRVHANVGHLVPSLLRFIRRSTRSCPEFVYAPEAGVRAAEKTSAHKIFMRW